MRWIIKGDTLININNLTSIKLEEEGPYLIVFNANHKSVEWKIEYETLYLAKKDFEIIKSAIQNKELEMIML